MTEDIKVWHVPVENQLLTWNNSSFQNGILTGPTLGTHGIARTAMIVLTVKTHQLRAWDGQEERYVDVKPSKFSSVSDTCPQVSEAREASRLAETIEDMLYDLCGDRDVWKYWQTVHEELIRPEGIKSAQEKINKLTELRVRGVTMGKTLHELLDMPYSIFFTTEKGVKRQATDLLTALIEERNRLGLVGEEFAVRMSDVAERRSHSSSDAQLARNERDTRNSATGPSPSPSARRSSSKRTSRTIEKDGVSLTIHSRKRSGSRSSQSSEDEQEKKGAIKRYFDRWTPPKSLRDIQNLACFPHMRAFVLSNEPQNILDIFDRFMREGLESANVSSLFLNVLEDDHGFNAARGRTSEFRGQGDTRMWFALMLYEQELRNAEVYKKDPDLLYKRVQIHEAHPSAIRPTKIAEESMLYGCLDNVITAMLRLYEETVQRTRADFALRSVEEQRLMVSGTNPFTIFSLAHQRNKDDRFQPAKAMQKMILVTAEESKELAFRVIGDRVISMFDEHQRDIRQHLLDIGEAFDDFQGLVRENRRAGEQEIIAKFRDLTADEEFLHYKEITAITNEHETLRRQPTETCRRAAEEHARRRFKTARHAAQVADSSFHEKIKDLFGRSSRDCAAAEGMKKPASTSCAATWPELNSCVLEDALRAQPLYKTRAAVNYLANSPFVSHFYSGEESSSARSHDAQFQTCLFGQLEVPADTGPHKEDSASEIFNVILPTMYPVNYPRHTTGFAPQASFCQHEFTPTTRTMEEVIQTPWVPEEAAFDDEEIDRMGRGSHDASEMDLEAMAAEDHLIFLKWMMDTPLFDASADWRKDQTKIPHSLKKSLAFVADVLTTKYGIAKRNSWIDETIIAEKKDRRCPPGIIHGSIHSDNRSVDARVPTALENLQNNYRVQLEYEQIQSITYHSRIENIIDTFEKTTKDVLGGVSILAGDDRDLQHEVLTDLNKNFIKNIRNARPHAHRSHMNLSFKQFGAQDRGFDAPPFTKTDVESVRLADERNEPLANVIQYVRHNREASGMPTLDLC